MKSNILLFLFLVFSLSCFAQHDFSIKLVPKVDFNSGRLQTDSTNFTFESNTVESNLQQYFVQKKETSQKWTQLAYTSNMPIVNPGNYNWNMPVAVPDSTINYAIREKRIELFNSLEKK